ncbi:gamma-taxilin [Leptopilina heterotoma]|uniref:gamma-taxilin n=1 Tax=Leptopilina heterotoma TaxID=63436 RepID=UPI001CA8A00C|nr:gamma-taxilin [Leptopilina heterotoma]
MDNDINESVKIEAGDAQKKTENITVEPKPVHHRERKHAKDEKPKKKEERGVEQVLKSLVSIENADEKLSAMCKKYSEVIDENRKLQLSLKQSEKKVQMIQREKDQLQTERSKAVLTRSRLESLCRELQRQNKAVKEESLLKLREEEEKRKEVSAKFQSTLGELTALMSQNNEKNTKLYEDNMEMSKNFKSLCEQVELREQQFEKIHQQMQLEIQLAEAKLAKVTLEMTSEKEALLNEKKQLLAKLAEYQLRLKEMQAQEVGLRSQISMYTDKYDEFQNALTKSNQVFGGFNEEMEKMSKKIHKLEKETGLWKHRWEKSHQALLEMAADKQTRDAEIEDLNRKRLLLLELCKAFQQERATLILQLKEKTIESNSVQCENQDNVKSIEQIENFTQVSEKLGNNLSQAQESLMQDIAAQEAKRTNPKADDPPAKTETTKRKEKKKQDPKQKKNEVSIVKDETKESDEKDNVQTNTTADEKINQEKQDKDTKVESVETKEELKTTEEIKEQETIKNSETKELEEINKNSDNFTKNSEIKEIEERNSDDTSKCSELPKNDENLEKNCLTNSESINQVSNDVELPLDNKTENIISDKLEVDVEKVEITNEIDKLSETLKNTDLNEKSKNNECLENKLISDLNCQENIKENCTVTENSQTESEKLENISELTVLTNSENVQIKTTSCPMMAKKGKEAKRKKK